MNKIMRVFFSVLIAGMASVACWNGMAALAAPDRGSAAMRETAERLVAAYPDANLALQDGPDGLRVVSGETRFLFSPWDGCPAAYPDDPLDAPLCALFAQEYPKGEGARHPAPGFDPGRNRNEAFLKFLYGENDRAVEKHLVKVNFFGETWKFSSRHGAAAALGRVAARLERAVAADPELREYILPGGGTYAWRKIKDSPRLSAHSFGVCIDLNIEKGIYWLWHPEPETIATIRRDYPQIIVDAFEAEGFIWGGKWHSFDFMHFEYRPELLR